MVYLPVLCDLQWYWFLLLFECVCVCLCLQLRVQCHSEAQTARGQTAGDKLPTLLSALRHGNHQACAQSRLKSLFRLRRSQIPQIPPTPAAVRTTRKKHETRISSIAGRSATGRLNAAQPVLHGVQWAHTVITNESSDISALQKVAEIMCYSEAAVLLMWSACFSGEPHDQQLRNTFTCRQGSWDQPAGRAAVALSTQGWPVCDCQTTQREWETQSKREREWNRKTEATYALTFLHTIAVSLQL